MKNLITHLILISIILITLFPLFWLVTASFRGDNAVFSSHILPQRWTLYNYKEILFPSKNVPSLLSDFNASVYAIGKFNNKSQEYREKYINDNLNKFYSLNEENIVLLNNAKKINKTIKERLDEEDFKRYMFDWLSNLKIEKPSTNSTITYASVYNILKELYTFHKKDKDILKWYSEYLKQFGVKSSMIYPRIRPYVIFRKYRTAYNEYLSENKTFKTENIHVEELSSKINSTKSSISKYTLELKNTNALLKEIDDFVANYLNNFSTAEEVLLKTSNINQQDLASYKSMLSVVSTICKYLPEQTEYPNLSKLLVIAKKLRSYTPKISKNADSVKYIFVDFIQKYNIIYRRIQEASNLFDESEQISNELKKSEEGLSKLQTEYSKVLTDFNKIKQAIIKKEKILNQYYAFTLYKFAIDNQDLQTLSTVLNEITKYANVEPSTALKYKNKLNDFIRLKTSTDALDSVIDSMEKQITEITSNIKEFSKRYKTYFILSKAGINKFNTPYLNKASNILNTIQNVTIADLNRRIKSIDNSLKSLNKKRSMELLSIKDSINHTYNKKIKHEFVRWIFNTIIVATISGIIVTVVVAITAYPFSRFRFKGRKSGLLSFLIIQMFPTVMAMVAFYNIVRFLGSVFPFIGLNTLGGLILVYLGGIAYNTWLAKGYYDTVPRSLEEAALIDGANRFQTFWIIVFPLVKPILTVIFIFTFIGAFNDFVMPKILLQDQDLYTYAIGLYQFVTGPYETEWGLFSAASLIGAVPIAVVFMLLQNFLVGGLTRGAVKG